MFCSALFVEFAWGQPQTKKGWRVTDLLYSTYVHSVCPGSSYSIQHMHTIQRHQQHRDPLFLQAFGNSLENPPLLWHAHRFCLEEEKRIIISTLLVNCSRAICCNNNALKFRRKRGIFVLPCPPFSKKPESFFFPHVFSPSFVPTERWKVKWRKNTIAASLTYYYLVHCTVNPRPT